MEAFEIMWCAHRLRQIVVNAVRRIGLVVVIPQESMLIVLSLTHKCTQRHIHT